MRRTNNSDQAHPRKPLLIAIAGSALLLLSSVLSNAIIQSGYGQPHKIREDLSKKLDQGLQMRKELSMNQGLLMLNLRKDLSS